METANMVTAQARRDAVLAGYRDDEETARSLLHHPAASVRASAYGALARGKYLRDEDVRAALLDAEPAVRRRGCALSSTRIAIDLRPSLRDQDSSVVEMASWAIGEQGKADAIPELTNIVYSHEEALCRESAVAALGAIGDETGLAAILHATGDKPAVRRRAVVALAPFSGPEVTDALQRAKEDRDWQVRQAAEDLLRIDLDQINLSETGTEDDSDESTTTVPKPDEEWPMG
jgi:HEAT repeat protein